MSESANHRLAVTGPDLEKGTRDLLRLRLAQIDAALDSLHLAVETLRNTLQETPPAPAVRSQPRAPGKGGLAQHVTAPEPRAPMVRTGVPPRAAVTSGEQARPSPRSAIDVRGLTKRFGSQVAVDRLTFRVPERSITGFVGPNGSGKTTTIRMLLHLAKRDAGSAYVLGSSVDRPIAYLSKVGALIESPAFEPGLSGVKNLRVHALLGGHPSSGIPDLLQVVGLSEAGPKPYGAYSLGMKQRLGIAAALLGNPRLIILDEPTNGLDPGGMREVRELLRRLRDAGKTIFVSSHLLDEIERICDHIVVIQRGRLVYQGSVQGLGDSREGGLEERILELTDGRR